jgi:hypothetical protein
MIFSIEKKMKDVSFTLLLPVAASCECVEDGDGVLVLYSYVG